ncbi:hypothetical protein [Pedobacter aquatilis]|uniref:hypothetical protein n=1 Tax=Pedobacter aquatilis TaxID=351343 RepID=UPI0029301D71|nr:hypothetical protein [Pedobacter aquatilis]
MKKFTLLLLVLFIANLSCKKITGGQPCACSPVSGPAFALTIKNSFGNDLLNPETSGYYDNKQLQIYSKDNNNVIKQISFNINRPFTITTDNAVTNYQLISYELPFLAKSLENTFYLKLGNDKLYELNLKVNASVIEKLLIDKNEAMKEFPNATSRPINEIYTLLVK